MPTDNSANTSDQNRRENFRIDDLLATSVQKIDNGVLPVSRVIPVALSGSGSLGAGLKPFPHEIDPSFALMLLEANTKLDLLFKFYKLSRYNEEKNLKPSLALRQTAGNNPGWRGQPQCERHQTHLPRDPCSRGPRGGSHASLHGPALLGCGRRFGCAGASAPGRRQPGGHPVYRNKRSHPGGHRHLCPPETKRTTHESALAGALSFPVFGKDILIRPHAINTIEIP